MAMKLDIHSILASARYSFVFLERGYLEKDGHAVVFRRGEELLHIPVGLTNCLLMGPGAVVTHEAVKTCADEGSLLVWVGEQGVRCYSAGMPGGAIGERLLEQAAKRLDPASRLRVARSLYRYMFNEEPPQCRGIDELRGVEGNRVKAFYKDCSKRHGVPWARRDYEVDDFDSSDDINKALSVANACLYGVTEAVILALGYSPAIGFIHTGDARSFVFDLADTIKMTVAVETAFRVVAKHPPDVESAVRHACRDAFRELDIARKLVTILDEVMQ